VWGAVVVGAVVVALLIKTFVAQAFYIPSASMEPTLKKDDRVLVNKLSYRLHDINRGDVVVFERPPQETATDIEDLIKRVVGLPGDVVTVVDGSVYVDGKELSEPYLADGTTTELDGVVTGCEPPPDAAPGCVVPEDHIFVMGDNRDFSLDSRVFGPIDEDLVVGRAFVQIWPVGDIGGL
jgi:signal peptidase I